LGNATTIWQNKVQMGMIATLGAAIELASSLALHCPGRRSGQRGAMEKSRSNGKFLFPVKALSKVLERSFAKTQSKRAYKIRANKTRFMEETLVVLPRNHLETQSLWWNIW
jgi:hypothetical protein